MLEIKGVVAALAVVAVGAVAPSMASASGTWMSGGTPIVGSVTAEVSAPMTLVRVGSLLQVTCDVTLDATLTNPNATLSATSATFANCVTNFPNCGVTVTASGAGSTLPWAGTGDAATQIVTLSNATYRIQFASCPPPLSNNAFTDSGTLSPNIDTATETMSFDGTSATGTMTGPLGTSYWNGSLDVTTPSALGLS